MGAAFRMPVWEVTPEQLAALTAQSGLSLLATALRADTVPLQAVHAPRTAVVIGSEGNGVSQEVLNLCSETVRIPMNPRCESLNAAAAAAVVLWELYRERGSGTGGE